MRLIVFLIGMIALAAGCKSDKPRIITVQPKIDPLPEVAGTYIPPGDRKHLRSEEYLKAYTVGRLVDPADPTVMHEQGVVYRVERPNSWNLQPNAPIAPPFGGVKEAPTPDKASALEAELSMKLNEVRKQHRTAKARDQLLGAQGKALKDSMMMNQKLSSQNAELSAKLAAQREEIRKLQGQIQSLIKYYEILKKENQSRPVQRPAPKSKYRRD